METQKKTQHAWKEVFKNGEAGHCDTGEGEEMHETCCRCTRDSGCLLTTLDSSWDDPQWRWWCSASLRSGLCPALPGSHVDSAFNNQKQMLNTIRDSILPKSCQQCLQQSKTNAAKDPILPKSHVNSAFKFYNQEPTLHMMRESKLTSNSPLSPASVSCNVCIIMCTHTDRLWWIWISRQVGSHSTLSWGVA